MKLEGGRHRDTTQVKGLSPEITNVSEVDAVHLAADNILATVTGKAARARRGLRPCQDVKELI
ncbi:MAG: hypothetical protein AUJ75_00325 [Candidatus Omnitrophica bacterium CG1_02_49_10]|nr:MAG: hypothetical protein AUJ75_00325 [Candidatus Omnitrophica bacterium CG1_02_49_10]